MNRLTRSSIPVLLILTFLALFATGCTAPQRFASPDQALDSLVNSLRAGDNPQLQKILGSEGADIIESGDAVEDANRRALFLKAYEEKHTLVPTQDGRITVIVGNSDWPMPIPIIKDPVSNTWYFDTAAGKDELINRRIGRNELNAMQVCLAIADAQREYAERDPDNDGIETYARQIVSDAGRRNGLYFPTHEGEPPSPLGLLVAEAENAGYKGLHAGHPRPFHGYNYRILKAQGPHATGGQRDYIINGKMIGGFALVASPAEYGNSGIATFIINYEGKLYQCDLGPKTDAIAAKMTEFDPDPQWKEVDEKDLTTQTP
jgi:hypothetical protein